MPSSKRRDHVLENQHRCEKGRRRKVPHDERDLFGNVLAKSAHAGAKKAYSPTRKTTYEVWSYSGPVELSGSAPAIYMQLACGRKAGPTGVYTGESMHGHGGRYFGRNSSSSDRLAKGTHVNILYIVRTRGAMAETERRFIEGMLTDVVEAHAFLGERVVTEKCLRGANPFLRPSMVQMVAASCTIMASQAETFFKDGKLQAGHQRLFAI